MLIQNIILRGKNYFGLLHSDWAGSTMKELLGVESGVHTLRQTQELSIVYRWYQSLYLLCFLELMKIVMTLLCVLHPIFRKGIIHVKCISWLLLRASMIFIFTKVAQIEKLPGSINIFIHMKLSDTIVTNIFPTKISVTK